MECKSHIYRVISTDGSDFSLGEPMFGDVAIDDIYEMDNAINVSFGNKWIVIPMTSVARYFFERFSIESSVGGLI